MVSPAPRSRRLDPNPPHPASSPTVPADEAGGHGLSYRYAAAPLPGIAPVAGWSLLVADEEDGDGFVTRSYVARSSQEDVLLDVSRLNFTPSQERFSWLVRNGFPSRPSPKGAWFNNDIDARIAAERLQVAA